MFKEDELALAQEAAGLAIWEWRADTNEFRWLSGSIELFGQPFTSLRTIEDVLSHIAAEDRERVARLRDEAVRTNGRLKVDYRVVWPNGELRWIRATGQVLERAGIGKVLIGVSQDITTDRKREEQLLAQARLLDMTHEPILVRDKEDRIRFWNKGAERLYGFSRADAAGVVSHDLLRTKFPAPLHVIQRQLASDRKSTRLNSSHNA